MCMDISYSKKKWFWNIGCKVAVDVKTCKKEVKKNIYKVSDVIRYDSTAAMKCKRRGAWWKKKGREKNSLSLLVSILFCCCGKDENVRYEMKCHTNQQHQ